MPDIPLDDRVNAAFRPNRKLSARLASLDAREALAALLRTWSKHPSTWQDLRPGESPGDE